MRSILLLTAAFMGCDDHKFAGGHTSEAVEGAGVEAVQAIFNNNCVACHAGSQAPDLSIDLCDGVVNVASAQLVSMDFVTPEDPENSYLLHKMKGTAGSVGGADSIMPPAGQLAEGDIQIVEDWIAAGASCEPTTTDTVDTSTDTATSTDRDGATIHDSSCQACHANNGLDLATVVPPLSDAALEGIIVYGQGSMPAQGLTDGELSNIMTYLRDTYPSQ